MSLLQLMDKTADIERKTKATPDGMGGFSLDWEKVGTVDMTLHSMTPSQQEIWMRLGVKANYTARVPPDTDITEEDRLVYQGRFLYVRGKSNPAEMSHHLKLALEEVR